jgi:hypothetical protein
MRAVCLLVAVRVSRPVRSLRRLGGALGVAAAVLLASSGVAGASITTATTAAYSGTSSGTSVTTGITAPVAYDVLWVVTDAPALMTGAYPSDTAGGTWTQINTSASVAGAVEQSWYRDVYPSESWTGSPAVTLHSIVSGAEWELADIGGFAGLGAPDALFRSGLAVNAAEQGVSATTCNPMAGSVTLSAGELLLSGVVGTSTLGSGSTPNMSVDGYTASSSGASGGFSVRYMDGTTTSDLGIGVAAAGTLSVVWQPVSTKVMSCWALTLYDSGAYVPPTTTTTTTTTTSTTTTLVTATTVPFVSGPGTTTGAGNFVSNVLVPGLVGLVVVVVLLASIFAFIGRSAKRST